jgi:hypothetical protein
METNDKIKKLEKELNEAKKAKELFPNVEIETDRWDNERFYSCDANSKADRVQIHRSCGCCSGAAIYARPYITDSGTAVYSNPPSFTIAYGNEWGYGVEESEGWEEKMREKNISEEAIKKCREYLDENKPEPYEDDDE